ncbi:MAG: hypothetical protein JNG85_04350, partial [Spirochaetaceae bacterium]|nr:hypothetical protein [Spirochaetaceae bacterium]
MRGFYHGSPKSAGGNEGPRFVLFLVGLLAAFIFVLVSLSLLERSSREVAGLVERLELEERLSARFEALGVTGP